MSHSKEPWISEMNASWGVCVRGSENKNGKRDYILFRGDAGNAERIVECVNALCGIENPAVFVERYAKLDEALRLLMESARLVTDHARGLNHDGEKRMDGDKAIQDCRVNYEYVIRNLETSLRIAETIARRSTT